MGPEVRFSNPKPVVRYNSRIFELVKAFAIYMNYYAGPWD